jgi:hypothetical protein
METDFVPYELALELKQLGFDEPCFGYYDIKDNNLQLFSDNLQDASCNSDLKYDDFKHCTTPTYSQAFRFFRNKYKLSGIPTHQSYEIWNLKTEECFIEIYPIQSYEEAELACLNKLIEIVNTEIIWHKRR